MKQYCTTNQNALEPQGSISAEFIPAPENATAEIVPGVFLPVKECAILPGSGQAVPVIETISDYKWQLDCLNSRLKNPEQYRKGGEDVEAVIATIRQWLQEHTPD